MAQSYISAVKAKAPQATLVFDRFHIERHLSEAVNEVRKREFWRRGKEMRDLVRGKKFLLLRRRRRVHWRHRGQLDALLRANRHLLRAYVLKEDFEQFWSYRSRTGAERFLAAWTEMLRWTRLAPLHRFAKMLWDHFEGVLSYATFPMSNAALEGNNSRIELVRLPEYIDELIRRPKEPLWGWLLSKVSFTRWFGAAWTAEDDTWLRDLGISTDELERSLREPDREE